MFGQTKKPEVNLREEMSRRKSHRNTFLARLKSGDYIDTNDLARVSRNHTARISELRKEGHVILSQYEGHGVYSYHYLGSKDEE
jgi:hypothetical protein